MRIRRTLALGGALAALSLVLASTALAAAAATSVRVEGLKRTLLPATVVRTRAGSITKGGAPVGTCPSTSAAGALDVATKHRWGGTYNAKYSELELTSILGESWPFTQSKYYWSIWVNNRFATAGMCQITLHRGDRILFAVDSDKTNEYPLGLTAPSTATAGRAFTLKVVWYNDAGRSKPLAGASIGGVPGRTNRQGVLRITGRRPGTLRLTASRTGYFRSAAVTVTVKR